MAPSGWSRDQASDWGSSRSYPEVRGPAVSLTPSRDDVTADWASRIRADGVSELWVIYHDYTGRPQVKSVPPERFEAVAGNGVSFAKANLDFNVLDDQVPDFVFGAETGDFLAVPDPDTYARMPHRTGAARTYSYLHLPSGEVWAGCARSTLSNLAGGYSKRGLSVQAAFEPECYLFTRTDGGYAPADSSPMFTVSGLDHHRRLMTSLAQSLRGMGVLLEQVAPEYGPGQYEINIQHQPPLKAADDLMTVKEVLRALAEQEQLVATFMPKPFSTLPGCGIHVHIGLTNAEGKNAVVGDGPVGLNQLGTSFVAGLLRHARALCGLAAPTVNSYKRLLPGSWAPAHICYGASNRAALVRVPDAGSRHLEFRAGDGTGNPYLVLIGLLAAGLHGIEEGFDPGDPVTDDVGHLGYEQAAARGLDLLPRSAPEALDALEANPVVMDALGPVIGPTFLRVKRSEAATYAVEVGDWERSAYLEWS